MLLISMCLTLASHTSLLLMFAGRPEPTRVGRLLGVPLLDRLLALPSKFNLGWKGLLVTNTQAFIENIGNLLSHKVLGPGHLLFIAVYTKLGRLIMFQKLC